MGFDTDVSQNRIRAANYHLDLARRDADMRVRSSPIAITTPSGICANVYETLTISVAISACALRCAITSSTSRSRSGNFSFAVFLANQLAYSSADPGLQPAGRMASLEIANGWPFWLSTKRNLRARRIGNVLGSEESSGAPTHRRPAPWMATAGDDCVERDDGFIGRVAGGDSSDWAMQASPRIQSGRIVLTNHLLKVYASCCTSALNHIAKCRSARTIHLAPLVLVHRREGNEVSR